jgi:hypothetical protein
MELTKDAQTQVFPAISSGYERKRGEKEGRWGVGEGEEDDS